MIQRFFILIIVIIEGGALLSYEVLSAKVYTPYIGSTIYVWTSILTITLISLGLSYRLSQYFISKKIWSILPISLFISGIYLIGIYFLKDFILGLTISLEIKSASILSGIFLIFIPIFAMGIVTPTISAFHYSKGSLSHDNIGKISGYLYALGTLSGVLFTLFYTYLIVPNIGVESSILIIASSLLASSILAYLTVIKWK